MTYCIQHGAKGPCQIQITETNEITETSTGPTASSSPAMSNIYALLGKGGGVKEG